METRVAVMSIIVENTDYAEEINNVLHMYGKYVIGRMGLPYREKKINIIISKPLKFSHKDQDAVQHIVDALNEKY